MTTEINLGNLVIPIIKPQKGTDYYTEAEKQELISIVTNNVNSVIMPQEQTRQENEATRQSNEETRQSQENTRQSNEVSRQTAESARVEAENLRQSNEASRISAEQARVGTFNTQMQAVDTAIAGIHTSQDAYDQNAQAKTEAFNTNATNKINVYNENASEKIAEYDEHVHDYETELANKVDKVQGKGLSTNDYDNTEKGKVQANTEARHTHSNKSVLDGTTASYTTEEKSKLAELENYDDTELREDIEQNRTSIEENYKEITKLQEENEDLKKNQLTNTPTPATSHYLQDSADSRFRKFSPIGRTTQESTTGKNLCTGAELQSNENIKFYFDRNYLEKTFTLSFICNEALNANSVYLDKSNGMEYLLSMSSVANTTAKVTITLTDEQYNAIQSATYWNLRIYKGGASFTVPIEPMIQNGSTATPYEPYTGGEPAPSPKYPFPIKNTGDNGSVNEKVSNSDGTQEQNISFPLAQGQKLMEGDYLADDDEKVHHKHKQDIVNIGQLATLQDGLKGGVFNILDKVDKKNNFILCNKCIFDKTRSFIEGTVYENEANVVFVGSSEDTLETLKSKYDGAILQYELAEEQTEDFTEEQKTAWKEWKKARTYKNVTHISSEDETPANVEIEYVQDTKTYIDNQIESLKSAIISLGGNV